MFGVYGFFFFNLANTLGAEYFQRESVSFILSSFNAEFSIFIPFFPKLILKFPSISVPNDITSGESSS